MQIRYCHSSSRNNNSFPLSPSSHSQQLQYQQQQQQKNEFFSQFLFHLKCKIHHKKDSTTPISSIHYTSINQTKNHIKQQYHNLDLKQKINSFFFFFLNTAKSILTSPRILQYKLENIKKKNAFYFKTTIFALDQ